MHTHLTHCAAAVLGVASALYPKRVAHTHTHTTHIHVYIHACVYAAPGGRFTQRMRLLYFVHRELRNTHTHTHTLDYGKNQILKDSFRTLAPKKALFFVQIKFPLPVGS